MARVSTFLITVAFITGMVSCGEVAPPAQYNLTMSVAPAGSGTATDLTNASPYAAGAGVSIKAVANPGYRFVNWTTPAGGFADTNAAQTTFTMPTQNATITANFAEGQVIRTWYDLDDVRDHPTSHFIVVNNLDSTTPGYAELASMTANGGQGWEPIENFGGSLDGQGHEIKDLFIDRPEESYVGLFSSVNEAGRIQNITLVSTISIGDGCVGGLVGANFGVVSNSYASGNMTGWVRIGGVTGWNFGTVSNCYASTSVSGNWGVGGIAGDNAGTVINSYSAACVIVSDGQVVGGLVGGNNGTVSNSCSTGSVTAEGWVGGLIGQHGGIVSNSYSSAEVMGSYRLTGGLVGALVEGTVSNCYATGRVSGDFDVGGLVGGRGINYSTVDNSFWDIETSSQATSVGGMGLTTRQMKSILTFSTAWNITTVANPSTRNPSYIWNIVDGQTYPFLSWQS